MRLVWSPKFTRSAKKLARRKPELLNAGDPFIAQKKAAFVAAGR